jgi:hypothetical protein
VLNSIADTLLRSARFSSNLNIGKSRRSGCPSFPLPPRSSFPVSGHRAIPSLFNISYTSPNGVKFNIWTMHK